MRALFGGTRRVRWFLVGMLVSGVLVPAVATGATALECSGSPGNHVAVVVDFGTGAGSPGGIDAQCVAWQEGQTGLVALRSASTGQIGFDRSSKICQIDGYPQVFDPTNCSAPKNGAMSYWAYFRGTSSGWTYNDVGEATRRTQPAVVEGWRYVTVPVGSHVIPPPRNFTGGAASSMWQSTCPTEPTSSPPTTAGGRASDHRR